MLCFGYAMRATFVRSYAVVLFWIFVVFFFFFYSLHQIYFNRHILVVCWYVSISSCYSLSFQLCFIWVLSLVRLVLRCSVWTRNAKKKWRFFFAFYTMRAFNDYVCPKSLCAWRIFNYSTSLHARTVVVVVFCILCFLISFHIQLSELLCI